jgi:hypothetical protein
VADDVLVRIGNVVVLGLRGGREVLVHELRERRLAYGGVVLTGMLLAPAVIGRRDLGGARVRQHVGERLAVGEDLRELDVVVEAAVEIGGRGGLVLPRGVVLRWRANRLCQLRGLL